MEINVSHNSSVILIMNKNTSLGHSQKSRDEVHSQKKKQKKKTFAIPEKNEKQWQKSSKKEKYRVRLWEHQEGKKMEWDKKETHYLAAFIKCSSFSFERCEELTRWAKKRKEKNERKELTNRSLNSFAVVVVIVGCIVLFFLSFFSIFSFKFLVFKEIGIFAFMVVADAANYIQLFPKAKCTQSINNK